MTFHLSLREVNLLEKVINRTLNGYVNRYEFNQFENCFVLVLLQVLTKLISFQIVA